MISIFFFKVEINQLINEIWHLNLNVCPKAHNQNAMSLLQTEVQIPKVKQLMET